MEKIDWPRKMENIDMKSIFLIVFLLLIKSCKRLNSIKSSSQNVR